MAKGSKSRSGTRDAVQSLPLAVRFPRASAMREIQDLRTFDFEPDTRPARLFTGGTAAIGVSQPSKKQARGRGRVPFQIAFQAPQETLVCVRRSRRRQTLFAKKLAGKRGQKKPRWTAWSKIKCR